MKVKYSLLVFRCICSWPFGALSVVARVEAPFQTQLRTANQLLPGTWLPL